MRVHQLAVVVVPLFMLVIVCLAGGEQLDALAGGDDRQILPQGKDLVHELLHAPAADDQCGGILQRDHVACLQLVIVQAADALLGHVADADALNALADVLRQHIHRIKARDHGKIRLLLGRAASGQQADDKQRSERRQTLSLHITILSQGQNPITMFFSCLFPLFLPVPCEKCVCRTVFLASFPGI